MPKRQQNPWWLNRGLTPHEARNLTGPELQWRQHGVEGRILDLWRRHPGKLSAQERRNARRFRARIAAGYVPAFWGSVVRPLPASGWTP